MKGIQQLEYYTHARAHEKLVHLAYLCSQGVENMGTVFYAGPVGVIPKKVEQ